MYKESQVFGVWYHQARYENGGYVCKCFAKGMGRAYGRCPTGAFMHGSGVSNTADLYSFRQKESNGQLSSYFLNIDETLDLNVQVYTDYVCEACPVGMYNPPNSGKCSFCPSGRYNDQIGQTTCPHACAAGTSYSNEGRQADSTKWSKVECDDCAAGKYQSNEAQGSCLSCGVGRFQQKSLHW